MLSSCQGHMGIDGTRVVCLALREVNSGSMMDGAGVLLHRGTNPREPRCSGDGEAKTHV